jgi:hypothetical protein
MINPFITRKKNPYSTSIYTVWQAVLTGRESNNRPADSMLPSTERTLLPHYYYYAGYDYFSLLFAAAAAAAAAASRFACHSCAFLMMYASVSP